LHYAFLQNDFARVEFEIVTLNRYGIAHHDRVADKIGIDIPEV